MLALKRKFFFHHFCGKEGYLDTLNESMWKYKNKGRTHSNAQIPENCTFTMAFIHTIPCPKQVGIKAWPSTTAIYLLRTNLLDFIHFHLSVSRQPKFSPTPLTLLFMVLGAINLDCSMKKNEKKKQRAVPKAALVIQIVLAKSWWCWTSDKIVTIIPCT